jgi:hypothetical protein
MKELAKVDELWGDPDRSLARTDFVGKFATKFSHSLIAISMTSMCQFRNQIKNY